MSIRVLAVLLFVTLDSALAFAQEPPPADPAPPGATPTPPPPAPVVTMPTPIAPAPMLDVGGPPHNGFQIQARLATQIGFTAIVSPGFSLGYRMGNLVFAGQLGITAGKIQDEDMTTTTTDKFSVVQLVPMVYWDVWRSRDHRARMNIVGGLGVGKAKIESEVVDAGTTTTTETSADFGLILAGIGGDYYLHKNFALGVEVSAQLPVLTKIEDDGVESGVTASTQSIHGLIRFTFITGD